VLEAARREALGAERRANDLERHLLHAQRVESLGQVASGVAHDFNNILMVIRQSAELALDPAAAAADSAQEMRAVIEASERGRALTRQLLDFSRGTHGKTTSSDLNARLRALLPMLERLAARSVGIELRLSSEVLSVRIDGTQLDQLVVNLVANARDAMPLGGRIVVESALAASPSGASGGSPNQTAVALLRISDNGAGIPAELHQRIFEPFFTTKTQERGTGLGLATCASVVKRANGTIALTSAVGEGTTFEIYLPLA
jgi:signal transduction histidine kinase